MPDLPPTPASTAHQDKLYLVTRADLSPGYQIAQAVHVAAAWHRARPEQANTWAHVSNSLIVLATPDEAALLALLERAHAAGLDVTAFREQDLCDELTALAFTPGDGVRKLVSNLPLAGKPAPDPEAALVRERALRELSAAMTATEQTPGQDVLTHGSSVREHYLALLQHLDGRIDLNQAPNWALPGWVDAYREQLAGAVLPRHQMERYLTLHDCGKPSVAVRADDGVTRFPGHAGASAGVYAALPGGTDPLVEALIAGDMDVHLLKAADIPDFVATGMAPSQLLAGLAEVTSNAAMFGGTSSTSYKIKAKHLKVRGNAICLAMFGPAPTAPAPDGSRSHREDLS